MNLRKYLLYCTFVLVVMSEMVSGIAWPVSDESTKQMSSSAVNLTGWFTIIWGDSSTGTSSETRYQLTDETEKVTRLLLDQSLIQGLGGVLSLNNRRVSVGGSLATSFPDNGAPEVLNVSFITLVTPAQNEPLAGDVLPLVSGSKPWVSIMCKFNDFADEPEDLAYFQGMYSSTYPGMDHYWREQSYGTVNVAGSTAAGWFVLPHSEVHYNPTDTQGGTNLALLANDCIAAADPSVNFPLYAGINMMFNTNFDNGYAWGGSQIMTLDGVTKRWSTTWEPPWGYAAITVIAHEMGHGFGLPHSSGAYGQTYDNEWDVMSDSWANCSRSRDATYGCLGQHTISYHKDELGWIPSAQKFTAGPGTNITLDLERLALPTTSDYKMVQIPISGSSTHFYTVEARRQNGYDYKLPGQAVIIHEVDTARTRPAYVVDPDGNGYTGDDGARWIAGETFSDTPNQISVSVLSATPTGFQINVNVVGSPPTAVTNAASGIEQTSASLNGTANPNNSPTTAWFEWGTSDSYGQSTSSVDVGLGDSLVAYSRSITGLSCGGNSYHFRAVANNNGGTVYGSDRSFTTTECTTDTFTVGGSVSGLVGTGLVLSNNGQDIAIPKADPFTFTFDPQADGSTYAVTVKTQPTELSQICTVNSGSGTVAGANVTDVTVTCSVFCNVNMVSGVTEDSVVSYEACEILVLGPDFIAADGSDISVNSGWEIDFMPGFMVEQGATLNANVCGQSLCMSSDTPMPLGCHSCVNQICSVEGYSYCCEIGFDKACLDMVGTECGLVCESEP